MSNYFVYDLDSHALGTFRQICRNDSRPRLHYAFNHLGRSESDRLKREGVCLSHADFHLVPERASECQRASYTWAERTTRLGIFRAMIKKFSRVFQIDERHLRPAFAKALAIVIRDDVRAICIGRELSSDDRPIFLVAQKKLLELLGEDVEMFQIRGRGRRALIQMLAFSLHLLLNLMRPKALSRRTETGEPRGVVFEQRYDFLDGNPEFWGFYDSFRKRDDVVYNCSRKASIIYRFLAKEGQPVVVHWYRPASLYESVRGVVSLVTFWTLFIASKESADFGLQLLYMVRSEVHMRGVLATYRPRYFLRIRADLDVFHPIVTGICERFDCRHIGYQCGNYYNLTEGTAFLDFHIYGVWGHGFYRQAFAGIWPKRIKYLTIGPFTIDAAPQSRVEGQRKSFAVGLLTTSYSRNVGTTPDYYRQFLEACYATLAKADVDILLKEKVYIPINSTIESEARRRFGVQVRTAFCNLEGIPERVLARGEYTVMNSAEAIDQSDFLIVMWNSSVAWEALACRKKILVFMDPYYRHHFEDILPQLVVRTEAELQSAFLWLWEMPQREYEELIEPLVCAWGKDKDGNMVDSFWNEVIEVSEEGETGLHAPKSGTSNHYSVC